MNNAEAPRLLPHECLVRVDRTERSVIEKAITYLYGYGVDTLLAKGYDTGRVKVSFPQADAGITILTLAGRQPSRTPLRFYSLESGVTALREGSINLGVIPEGVIVKPTKYKDRLVKPLQNPEPEIIVRKLLYYFENYPPVIDVEKQSFKYDYQACEMRHQWESLHCEALGYPLSTYGALHYE